MTVLNKIASRLIDEGKTYTTEELMARLKVFGSGTAEGPPP